MHRNKSESHRFGMIQWFYNLEHFVLTILSEFCVYFIKMKSVLLTRLLSLFTYFSPTTTIFILLVGVYYVLFKLRRKRLEQLMAKIPGPAALPIIGNTLEVNIGYDGNDFTVDFLKIWNCVCVCEIYLCGLWFVQMKIVIVHWNHQKCFFFQRIELFSSSEKNQFHNNWSLRMKVQVYHEIFFKIQLYAECNYHSLLFNWIIYINHLTSESKNSNNYCLLLCFSLIFWHFLPRILLFLFLSWSPFIRIWFMSAWNQQLLYLSFFSLHNPTKKKKNSVENKTFSATFTAYK